MTKDTWVADPKPQNDAVNYDDDTSHLGGPMEITYEKTAVGVSRRNRADKSDAIPD